VAAALAGKRNPSWDPPLACLGYQQLLHAGLGSAVALTVPAGTRVIDMQVAVGAVRLREDGTAPTAGIGSYYAAGMTKRLVGLDFAGVKVIEATGSSTAEVNVTYYGYSA
jgi:hypothetical protein